MPALTTYAKAKAFTLWIKNIIGEEPEIYVYDGNVEIRYTDLQKRKMQSWLDDQIGGILDIEKEPKALNLNLGEILAPWSFKYMIPAMGAVFSLGYVTKSLLRSRR